MKLLSNKKEGVIVTQKIFLLLLFLLVSLLLLILEIENAGFYICILGFLLAVIVIFMDYRFYLRQNEIMGQAIEQIKKYISGEENARIECDEEGEIYQLFHEVNSLVAILEAHTQKEEKEKHFLKNTIADISHQLKTPLAALNIYNGILQEEVQNSPTMKEFTDLSEKELDRIETLIQNLLKLTKFDSGTMVLEKKQENIAEIMRCVSENFAFRAKQEEKKICLSGAEDITFLCDRDWLMEAIHNIVKNALDHTETKDEIDIIWKQLTSIIQIQIKDNGFGIPPEDLYHIFKRFYRSRFSKDTQGIGLGLPLAKMIIETHGGTIEVDSEFGVGTTFTINLRIPTKL